MMTIHLPPPAQMIAQTAVTVVIAAAIHLMILIAKSQNLQTLNPLNLKKKESLLPRSITNLQEEETIAESISIAAEGMREAIEEEIEMMTMMMTERKEVIETIVTEIVEIIEDVMMIENVDMKEKIEAEIETIEEGIGMIITERKDTEEIVIYEKLLRRQAFFVFVVILE